MPAPVPAHSSPRPRRILGAAILLLSLLPLAAAGQEAPELTVSTALSEDGFFRVQWPADPEAPPPSTPPRFELQQRVDDGPWETLYVGPDRATTVSGRPEGRYAYRVRAGSPGPDGALAPPTAWSAPAATTVRYHSLARAFAFFGVGAVVFLATAGLILAGQRKARADGMEGVA